MNLEDLPLSSIEVIWQLLEHAELLNEWELGFLKNISECDSLTPRQQAVLDRLVGQMDQRRARRRA